METFTIDERKEFRKIVFKFITWLAGLLLGAGTILYLTIKFSQDTYVTNNYYPSQEGHLQNPPVSPNAPQKVIPESIPKSVIDQPRKKTKTDDEIVNEVNDLSSSRIVLIHKAQLGVENIYPELEAIDNKLRRIYRDNLNDLSQDNQEAFSIMSSEKFRTFFRTPKENPNEICLARIKSK